MKARLAILAAAVACALPPAMAQAPAAAQPMAITMKTPIATVNGRKVTVEDFERAFTTVARNKFYHRTPPEAQLQQARREVADGLVDRVLLLGEAERRKIPVDQDAIQQTIDGYEKRYSSSPNWKEMREKALPDLKQELANQQLLAKLEAEVKALPEPGEKAVRAYYDKHPELFTQPEQVHLSVILLKVDPSSPKAVRDQAREEGRAIRERLARGADFAELAKIHSGDESAKRGGDLGFMHRGTIPEAIHAAVDALKPGDMTPSMDVLEGVAIIKLHERKASALRDYESVQGRARDLLKREASDAAWKEFVAGLRRNAVIETVAALYPAAPAEQDGGKEGAWSAADKPRGP